MSLCGWPRDLPSRSQNLRRADGILQRRARLRGVALGRSVRVLQLAPSLWTAFARVWIWLAWNRETRLTNGSRAVIVTSNNWRVLTSRLGCELPKRSQRGNFLAQTFDLKFFAPQNHAQIGTVG